MLKNWTVTTQAVKNGSDGVMIRERYLLSNKHPNHSKTEKITSIIGSPNTTHRIAIAGEQFRLRQKLTQIKGGRPLSSFGVEFCLTLPKGHRPTYQQWRNISIDCCMLLARFLKLNKNELEQYKSQVRAVLHQQPQTGRTGSGDHVHLIIGKVVGKRVLKELQQKRATHLIKQAFNAAVLKHVGLDHKEYKPHELNRGKRLESWKYQQQKAEDAKHTMRIIQKLQTQADKWFKAVEENDIKQQKRQHNRLAKTFEELSSCALSSHQQDQVIDLQKRLNI
ncbi:hypothetical protein [Vibrio diazotrophicus]|uniref:hypothetical protein n=1 Tax=Vibrio diazotrophicus TaxID=685 RepID=UPI000C9DF65D|nr:hypothetical protein [Vibrio diazotrophicus]PNH80982.1 hypothetical protein C1N27_08230 [Vibrio diazotrophicus]